MTKSARRAYLRADFYYCVDRLSTKYRCTILTVIVAGVTFLIGSGVDSYSSLAALAPDVNVGLEGNVAAIVTPMQFAFGILMFHETVGVILMAITIPMKVAITVTLLVNWMLFI